jgi:2-dehydro-3-deoxyphosphogluconate aldolase/(4S)-4-hydroxy-2-oxoglutarate aldolase
MDTQRFEKLPLLGILRGVESREVAPLADLCARQGLPALEITCNTAGATRLIGEMVTAAAGRFDLGAGTVLSVRQAEEAVAAGASFLVSPVLVEEVAAWCRERELPYFPGAFTPQEIWSAWCAGATQVKLFPAKFLGPDYIREIKAPLDQVKLLACGGVSAETAARYFAAGADSAAFGASIFRRDWLARGDFAAVEAELEKLVRACRAAMKPST